MKINEVITEAVPEGYKSDARGNLIRKPGFFGGMKDLAKGVVQHATGAEVNPDSRQLTGWQAADDTELAAHQQAADAASKTVPVGKQMQVQLAMQPGAVKPSFAYKRANGWVNELGQAITDPESIKDLEDLLSNRGGQILTIPTAPAGRRVSRKRNQ